MSAADKKEAGQRQATTRPIHDGMGLAVACKTDSARAARSLTPGSPQDQRPALLASDLLSLRGLLPRSGSPCSRLACSHCSAVCALAADVCRAAQGLKSAPNYDG